MTVDEIRNEYFEFRKRLEDIMNDASVGRAATSRKLAALTERKKAEMLFEIAAQLATANEVLEDIHKELGPTKVLRNFGR